MDGYKTDWITTGATQPEKDRSPSSEPPPPAATTGSASSSEPREPARAPPPNPAAGSGNPASSVSSGGAEAEVKVVIPTGEGGARKEWDYDEGNDGKYTCAQCGMKPLRSWFLIEAVDGEGNLRCEYDVEGRLIGRCYECCRCRGKYAGPKDIYDDLLATHSEEVLQNRFRRECNKRHDKRSDVKKKRACAAEDQRMEAAPGENHRKQPAEYLHE